MGLTLGFIFAGLGAGSIMAAYLLALAGGISRGDLILPDVTGGAIIAIGLACVWIPGRIRVRIPAMLRRSKEPWIAYETYAAAVFMIALAVLARISGAAVELVVAVAAAAYMISNAQTIRTGRSRAAWRAPEIPSLIVITGLAQGVGLIALLSAIVPAIIRGHTLAPIAGMVLAAMGAYRWRDFSLNLTDAAVRQDVSRISLAVYLGVYALPFTLFLAALFPWAGTTWMLPIAGTITITTSAIWTNTLIMRLGRLRDFTASPIGL